GEDLGVVLVPTEGLQRLLQRHRSDVLEAGRIHGDRLSVSRRWVRSEESIADTCGLNRACAGNQPGLPPLPGGAHGRTNWPQGRTTGQAGRVAVDGPQPVAPKAVELPAEEGATLRPKVPTSLPTSGVRNPWSPWYRRCRGRVGS